MKYFCGIDLGTRSSSICIVNEKKEITHRWSGKNSNLIEELKKIEGDLQCIVESGPLSESICNQVEKIGAKIEIVDSRHTKALLHGKKKTDRIDAQVLAELAHLGWYKPIYRKSGQVREQRTIVTGRAALVKVSTQVKNTIRGLLKSHGIVLPAGGEGAEFIKNVKEELKKLSPELKHTMTDLLTVWQSAYERQREGYKKLTKIAKADPITKRLMTVPGVGPATALGFASAIANPARFKDGKQIAGYLGLAPLVHQSGDTHYHGRITKKGDKLTRWLLVEAAGVMLTRVKKSFPLKEWGLKLAKEKGSAKAKVAVARRLATLLYTLWKTESDFNLKTGEDISLQAA